VLIRALIIYDTRLQKPAKDGAYGSILFRGKTIPNTFLFAIMELIIYYLGNANIF